MLNPPLTRRASALLSRAPSPRTPSTRSPVQQPLHISSTDNRKSSDSWNSSNYDPADDPDLEWKPEHVLLLTRVCSPIIYSSTTYHIHPIFRPSMLFLRMYSPPLLAPFPLQTCSIKLPVVFLRPKVQVIGLTHFVLPGPNSSSFAVSVLRKSRPSKNYITPSKKRTWTRISNSFVRSSNAPLTLSAPSTAKTVWISCSLPSSIYAARTRFPGTSFFLPCILLVLISMQTFSDIELLIVSVILTTYSPTRPTIRAHRPLTLKLSMSLHPPPLR